MVKPGKLEYIIHVRKTWKTVLQGGVGGGPGKLKYIILVGITWKTVYIIQLWENMGNSIIQYRCLLETYILWKTLTVVAGLKIEFLENFRNPPTLTVNDS